MEVLLQAAEEDTREGPLFDDPDDLDVYDRDMAQLMRQVYSAFRSEVSGVDLRADASKLKDPDTLAGLQFAARGNTPLLRDPARATTHAARGMTPQRAFLENDAAAVTTGKRSRRKASYFERP